jgi:hypothetical protein
MTEKLVRERRDSIGVEDNGTASAFKYSINTITVILISDVSASVAV